MSEEAPWIDCVELVCDVLLSEALHRILEDAVDRSLFARFQNGIELLAKSLLVFASSHLPGFLLQVKKKHGCYARKVLETNGYGQKYVMVPDRSFEFIRSRTLMHTFKNRCAELVRQLCLQQLST